MRTVPEWIGKTDDARVPPKVRDRIFLREGKRCHLSGIEIKPGMAWDLDHIVALCNGGQHRESNLAPALRDKHKKKTAIDRRIKAKDDRVRKRHIGIKPKSKFPCSKDSPFKKKIGTGEVVRR
jgi:5-methylcytosine-specific restriction enzyme A